MTVRRAGGQCPGIYRSIYNNYAHFSTFFIICIVLLLLRLIGQESLARTGLNFHHLLDFRRKQGAVCAINLLIKTGERLALMIVSALLLQLTALAHCSRDYFPSSETLQHHLSRLLINKSQITWSEKVYKHVDQNFIPLCS